MSDFFSDPAPARPGTNLPEQTVSDLARSVKRTVEDAFGYVRVRGEISQPKRHTSGHIYLRLKDDAAVIEAVCWKGTAARLSIRPEEGMEVVCTGKLTTYPGRSQYQLIIDSMELAGEGALLKMLEERKRRLAAEGLFNPERKKPLPFLPRTIGVVTSPTGAVIRDILHRLADRFPRHVLLWPVAVQGEGAASQVARAIQGFNSLEPGGRVPRPDLIIVARGGGSLEDLMAFNEEIVVRAAADSRIPLISAVGHETDTTLIDFASDRRAPTPTAAAEMAVPVRAELLSQVLDDEHRLHRAMTRALDQRRTYVQGLARGLGDPRSLLDGLVQRLDDRGERLVLCMRTGIERRGTAVRQLGLKLRHPREVLHLAATRLDGASRALRTGLESSIRLSEGRYHRIADRLSDRALRRAMAEGGNRLSDLPARLERAHLAALSAHGDRLAQLGRLLESVSYRGVLSRGFALVTDAQGHPVTRAGDLTDGQQVAIAFQDGHRSAVIGDAGAAPPTARPARPARKTTQPPQGSLF
ncbi:exodeoxyribonuclease VII large subunit [Niveispirillum sp. KHB5.9]|uniref:exodeoxyribonuclease VII large subunit n=1 Tax=Niveispirillum sp. KHB5.9 TaxID=3400269 RepID=UPI003A8AE9E8